ncbi:MAG: tRNA (adenosine(37)-N6)-threonylcarbamoyltransferase complex ATPase subunit type 1 TsaE [bacterium]|nr:tRNA (adenosine(37)-N6)-threonylcarbamoyltransferase complex ATPase subunit type 1 TsaE [bacterium]
MLGLFPLANQATVVGLYGDLGAGKTTFVQAIAKALGVSEIVNSPTFLIFKTYQLKANSYNFERERSEQSKTDHFDRATQLYETKCSYKLLVHIDAYRLKSSDELRKLRFEELLADPENLILIEWADKVADLLPKDHTKLHFTFIDDSARQIRL